ncbi:hypothetical protein EPO17_02215 [Patescibacteria group bacterium]|nr:MAG: hypothetical protein EPO17_02215 [Patescibacteria group bacterium]
MAHTHIGHMSDAQLQYLIENGEADERQAAHRERLRRHEESLATEAKGKGDRSSMRHSPFTAAMA